MKTKPTLTLEDAQRIGTAALKYATDHQLGVTIAVVDDGGHVLWLQRMDSCAPVSSYIAQEKGRTSAMGRRESKVYEDIINQGRTAFLSAPFLQGMLEGGVPIIVDGHTVGAVGVSGVKSAQDAEIAKAGIAAL
jgi:glc operon protein GlcG